MALPINIKELINGKTVEWERIEFRKGWNPERTLKTITAFANDFNNWGGGYVILGIEEKGGKPVLPPAGLELNQIDKIQKELNNICRRIIPNYFPIVEPVDFQGRKILILWCPGGSVRPYKCPNSFGNKAQYFYYIRRFSSTVKPTIEEEKELISMSNQIPFDDRVNHRYTVKDFDLIAIKTFLNKIGSDLEKEIPRLGIEEIARKMNIAEGANEYLLPKNVGLLFFAKEPQKIFPSAQIEIVIFKDDSGIEFDEKIFAGNLFEQTFNALNFLKNQIVKEKIIKREGRAEADRFFNYPYQALEESVCNAVYHRGYDNDSPIEIRIYPGRIDIISFPGPLPPLNKEKLAKYQFDVRKYRNRRIGEFLKELHLTEGRQTGIPTILKEVEKNNSPKPVFETDEERSYFKTTFFIHPEFKGDEATLEQTTSQSVTKLGLSWAQAGIKLGLSWENNDMKELIKERLNMDLGQFEKFVLSLSQVCPKLNNPDFAALIVLLSIEPIDIKTLMRILKQTNRTRFKKAFINPLIEQDLINYTIPDKPKSPKQKYVITEKGKKLLENEGMKNEE
ncbi:ATP-binding protein [Desulfonauticus submarinus]